MCGVRTIDAPPCFILGPPRRARVGGAGLPRECRAGGTSRLGGNCACACARVQISGGRVRASSAVRSQRRCGTPTCARLQRPGSPEVGLWFRRGAAASAAPRREEGACRPVRNSSGRVRTPGLRHASRGLDERVDLRARKPPKGSRHPSCASSRVRARARVNRIQRLAASCQRWPAPLSASATTS